MGVPNIDALEQMARGGDDLSDVLRSLERQVQELQIGWERRAEILTRAF